MNIIKQGLSFFLLLFILSDILAQTKDIDPNQLVDRFEELDTIQVNTWNELASDHMFSRPDSGIYYSTKALALARSFSFAAGEAEALHSMAISYRILGNNAKSLSLNLEALRISKEEGIKDFTALSFLSLAEDYFFLEKYDLAKEHILKADSLFSKIEQSPFKATTASLLGITYLELKQVDSALYFSYRAKNFAESNDEFWVKHLPYRRLGELYNKLGNLDSALFYFRMAYIHPAGESGISYSRLAIAKTFLQMGQLDSSKLNAQEALIIAKENSLFPELIKTNLFFSELFEESDPIEALQFRKMAMAYSDTLGKLSNITISSDITDFSEQRRIFELNAAEARFRSQQQLNIFLGSVFTLMIIAFFLYRNNRQKQKSKLQIEGAYNQLKSTQAQLIQSEKMASLGELTAGIAHEIQNPLNFVNNFSEVSGELVDELQEELAAGTEASVQFAVEIADDLKQNLEKITLHGKRADAIVKGMLEHSKKGSGEKEPTDLNALADEFLRLSYQSFLAKDPDFQCELKTNLDSDLPKVSVIPQDIGKVLLNLMNNAFYAVIEKAKLDIEGYQPELIVSSKKTENGIELSVKDNGPGIPDAIKDKIFQPFFTTKPTGSGTGLGLSLSYDIIKAHGGELKVVSSEGDGSTFFISIPKTETETDRSI